MGSLIRTSTLDNYSVPYLDKVVIFILERMAYYSISTGAPHSDPNRNLGLVRVFSATMARYKNRGLVLEPNTIINTPLTALSRWVPNRSSSHTLDGSPRTRLAAVELATGVMT
jgi:hypothetical protein